MALLDELESNYQSSKQIAAPIENNSINFDELENNYLKSKPLTPGEAVAAQATNVLGAGLGFGDEVSAGVNSAIDYFTQDGNQSISDLYSNRKTQINDLQNRLSAQAPVVAAAGEILPSFLLPVGQLGKAKGVVGLLKNTGKAATIGAGYGATSGFFNADDGLKNRIAGAEQGGKLGALFGGGANILGAGVGKVGEKLTNAGKGYTLGAFNITANDIKKANKVLSSGKEDTPLLKSIDAIKKSGALKEGLDPGVVKDKVLGEIADKNKSVLSLIKKADEIAIEKGKAVSDLPDFKATQRYISRLKGDLKDEAQALFDKELNGYLKTLDNKGNLVDWQNVKVSLQKATKYDKDFSPLKNDITQLMASDTKRFIEKNTDNLLPKDLSGLVKKTNAEVGQRRPLVKILERNLAREQASNPTKSLIELMRTTGGFGVPILLGGAEYGRSGDLTNALTAAAAGKVLTSKGFQLGAGTALRKGGGLVTKGAEKMDKSNLLSRLGLMGLTQLNPSPVEQPQPLDQALSQLVTPEQLQPGRDLSLSDIQGEDMPKAEDIQLDVLPTDKTKRVKAVEQLIDSDPIDATIYEIESARNPKAKNPESSAAGGFQLLKKTASTLGVKDVFDLADNYKGYLKLKEENQNVLSNLGLDPQDPEALYSLHYLGSPVFKKVALKKPLTETEQEQVAYLKKTVLPRFRKIYTQKTMMV